MTLSTPPSSDFLLFPAFRDHSPPTIPSFPMMIQNTATIPPINGNRLLLFTGNIMTGHGWGGFLNTSMSKNNAELVNSLKNIKVQGGEERQWLWKEDSVIRLQNPEPQDELLTSGARLDEFNVTIKLFFLPDAKCDINLRSQYAKEALAGVAGVLGIDRFDTLILSLPGITLEMDDKDYSSEEFPVSDKTRQSWVDTWNVILEAICLDGRVSALGISEFGIIRLAAFLPHVKVRPVVDQINLRDSCDIPQDLLEFSNKEGIKLVSHMDQDNPLPTMTLQEILDDLGVSECVTEMHWVVKYTAIAKERGVIENKGYVVSAQTA